MAGNKINAKLVFSAFLIVLGIIYYIGWGLSYNVWADIGIYSPVAILISTGILGIILSTKEKK